MRFRICLTFFLLFLFSHTRQVNAHNAYDDRGHGKDLCDDSGDGKIDDV